MMRQQAWVKAWWRLVTVKPLRDGDAKGKGGRAGEFCLGLALALQGQPGVHAIAAE